MKKNDEYKPYVVDDTFSISEEVLAMSREERQAELRKYEEEMEKRCASAKVIA